MYKMATDLKIVQRAEVLPTLEIDADWSGSNEHREIIEACLKRRGAEHPDKTISIYDTNTSLPA
ncbi:MAG: hypothetical protein K2H64_11730 [Desulfovibrio sp.]|nr:hypothetical protein [Desulfovibrio sp.]